MTENTYGVGSMFERAWFKKVLLIFPLDCLYLLQPTSWTEAISEVEQCIIIKWLNCILLQPKKQ